MADSLSAITGLSSGIDYRALVDAIIAQEHQPADAAQKQIDLAAKRKDAVQTWRDLLGTLQTALDQLRNGTGLDVATASTLGSTSAGRPLFSATAASTALPATYQIEVTSLARAEKLGSIGVSDPAAALGLAGTFTLNGVAVTVEAGDSLAAIRDKINAVSAGTTPSRVAASILTVGPGESRLILTSQVSGSAGIVAADTAGSVLATLGLTGADAVLVRGSDAEFTVDGVPLVRTTNVVSDAISGVTLTLESEEEGVAGTLTVGRDTAAGTAAAKALVDAYNAAVKFVKDQSTPGATKPPLYGDPLLRAARVSLSRGILGVIGGDEGNPMTGSVAGFSLSKTGVLSLDETDFATAYTGSFDQLKALFAAGAGGTDLDVSLDAALATNTGTIDLKSTFLTTRMLQLQDRIDNIESRLDRRRAMLLQQFARMESTLGALQSQISFISTQSAGFNRSTG